MEPVTVERPKPGNVLELQPWVSTGRMKELEFDTTPDGSSPRHPCLRGMVLV